MDLVIVESPTKAKTLAKFLGKGYEVMASVGHVRDLPKSKLGVDVEHNFEPQYLIPVKAKPVVKLLKAAAVKAKCIWLSSDPDREGEAIAWHIMQVLAPANSIRQTGGRNSKFRRAVFHEITESAVKEAFNNPRDLDLNLVNSQQARRILDRIVGYKLSPLLWKKVARNLSAGRVQSVAVRLVVERERERQAFAPKEYWTIIAMLRSQAQIPDLTHKDPGSIVNQFEAQLFEKSGKKIEISSGQEAAGIESELRNLKFKIKEIKKEEKRRYPSPPFTTSTLQQTAGNRLGFSASRTMKAAQSLYENGLITYMRTDSVNLSQQFLDSAAAYIRKEFGGKYCPEKPIIYKTKSRLAQEAHEAIRPTNLEVRSKNQELSGDEARIYELIWNRAAASQMNPAVFDATTVVVSSGEYLFRANGSVIKFDGWLTVWGVKSEKSGVSGQLSVVTDEEAEGQNKLPVLEVGQDLNLENIESVQHFTEPKARFTEATLVKALEEEGIGRPSTYAPIISTVQKRGYVGREGRYLFPLDIGIVVNDLLVSNFPKIVDLSFTSQLEEKLDLVAEGKEDWVSLVRDFYNPFEKLIIEKEAELKKEDFTTLSKLDEKCPDCGKDLIVKIGKFGKFVSCSGFPKCKFTKPINSDGTEEVVDRDQLGKCPNDGGELTIKRGRFGQFIACLNYPNCKFTKPYLQKTGVKCPECHQGDVVAKRTGKGRNFFGCSRYPECKYASWNKPGTEGVEKLVSSKNGSGVEEK